MTNRRVFIGDLVRLAALAAVVPNDWRVIRRMPFAEDPFRIGIASGDPDPSSFVIWTRLIPRPLEPDGGMTGARVAVRWEVAEDDKFSRVVKRGTATATPEVRAALITSGSRASSGEPEPHHDETTSWIPAAPISRICALTTRASELE